MALEACSLDTTDYTAKISTNVRVQSIHLRNSLKSGLKSSLKEGIAMNTICRLCAEVSSIDDMACTIDDHDLNIRQKLIDCCRWDELHEQSDFYPKNMCKTCYGRLELSWNFSKSVARAQFKIFKFVEGGGQMDLIELPIDVDEMSVKPELEEICVVKSLPIVNLPAKFDFVTTTTEQIPLSAHESITIDANPLDSMADDADFIAVSHVAEITPATELDEKINIKNKFIDWDTDGEDVYGSAASLSSYEEKPTLPATTTNHADSVNNIALQRSFTSKLITQKKFVELIKDHCNADGSVNVDAIKKHQLVNWTLIQEICWICKFAAMDRATLRNHIRSEHPFEEVRVICTLCPNKTFASRHPLMRHTQKKHFPYLEFCCGKCNVLFRGKGLLKAHKCAKIDAELEAQHSYICEFCGRVLKNVANLKLHMQTHVPETERRIFECHICKLGGLLRRNLQNHIKDAHVTYDRKRFKCTYCDTTCTTKSGIKRHEYIHTNTFPFGCYYCEKRFRDRNDLKIHERKHTGERPYGCTVCSYRSRDQPNMDKHMTQQHGISYYKNRRKPLKIKERKRGPPVCIQPIPLNAPLQPGPSTFYWPPPYGFGQINENAIE